MARTLQIAAVGEDIDPILIGVREYPVAKLVLLYTKQHERTAIDLAKKFGIVKLPVELVSVGTNVLIDTLRTVTRIVQDESSKYDDVVINASGGDRMHSCAILSAAFVNGVKAVGVENNACFALPVLKFSYDELISEPKIKILKAIEGLGGKVDSLNELGASSGVEKSLLSYHIRGGRDRKGLEELGLIEVDRARQGRLVIRLTSMGKLMLMGN